METMQKRSRVVDLGKGIGILFIVCYHVLYLGGTIFRYEARIIASVVLFFFFASGYTYCQGEKTWKQRMGSRV